MIHSNILKTIGKTPIVRLNRLGPKFAEIYVKCESFNPGGSHKDRIAKNMIEEAEKSGELQPGQVVFETTGGNTGIGVAMVCAAKGYPCVLMMPAWYSKERRRLMKFLGARVIIPPDEISLDGVFAWSHAVADKNGWFHTSQLENRANPAIHELTTGPEILSAFGAENKKLDYFVAPWATGGTLAGVGRSLKSALPDLKVIAFDIEGSPVLEKEIYEGHSIEATTINYKTEFVRQKPYDEVLTVKEDDAIWRTRELAAKEGIMTGLSAGATVDAAIQVAENAPEGSNVLAFLPDTCERYMSTVLFEAFSEESDSLTPEEYVSMSEYYDIPSSLNPLESSAVNPLEL